LYKEWDEEHTFRQEQEYSALMALVMFPEGDPEPPDSPIAEQVLNNLSNALSISSRGQVDYTKKEKAHEEFAQLALNTWTMPKAPVRAPAPVVKKKESGVSDTLSQALDYIRNL